MAYLDFLRLTLHEKCPRLYTGYRLGTTRPDDSSHLEVETMTLMEFLLLLLIAGVAGAVGQSLAGYDLGGCLVSIVSALSAHTSVCGWRVNSACPNSWLSPLEMKHSPSSGR